MVGRGTVRNARQLRSQGTDAERKIWFHLRNRQLSGLKFRRQYPIGPFVVDFCCLEKRLVIELDGSEHLHRRKRDEERTSFLNNSGYRVLRFWDNETLKETKRVLERILEVALGPLTLALSQGQSPHPSPLPFGERG